MDTVVIVAIGILAIIFMASLAGLLFVCRRKYCKKEDHISQQLRDTRPDIQLIDEDGPRSRGEVELDEVQLHNPRLEEILHDEDWVDDVTGLVPHCLAILKTCHHLAERLVGMTMGNSDKIRTQEMLTDIITVARRINPRVDEVMQSMYPPLDARLLEARCTALVLSVSHLVLVTKHACKLAENMDWIDQSLADVDEHLKVLQEASIELSPDCRPTSNSVQSGDSQQAMMGPTQSQINESLQSQV